MHAVSSSSSQRRRVLRQQIRTAGGALLLLAGCLAAFTAILPSSNGSPSLSHRQLTQYVQVYILRMHEPSVQADALAANHNTTNAKTEAEDASCGVLQPWELGGGIFLYIFGLLYVFVALAIVCDDYFVTSLERITETLGLSSDVAGATFMAAGSSAPELFVSLADNVFHKPEGSMGVGTIVGSAIFNILIIISLSALLAGQELVLDWRPMLRDSLWYCWSIVVLAVAIWDGSVDVAESILLFGSYFAYCVYMSQNTRVVNAFCKRTDEDALELIQKQQEAEADARAERAARIVDAHMASTTASGVHATDSERRAWTIDVEHVPREGSEILTRQGSVGSTSTATTTTPRPHTAGAGHHDTPHHQHRLSAQSSKLNPMYRSKYRMFQTDHSLSHDQLARRSSMGSRSDLGSFSESTDSTAAIKHTMASSLRPVSAPTLAAAAASVSMSASASVSSMDKIDVLQEVLGGYFEELYTMPNGALAKVWFVFTRPIVLATRLTIPDCRYPQFAGTLGFVATFVLSIAWIAVLSHFTIVWATRFGCIAGIPSALMGLTILAAGTSVPDAMSSVLVARDGHGDMAVSNALGSNVFDILFGLGLPFFLSNLVYREPVTVLTDDLEISVLILFVVLVTVVGLLVLSAWRLRRSVGAVMITLYAVYVVLTYGRGMGWF